MNKTIRHLYTFLDFREPGRPVDAHMRHHINTMFLLCGLSCLVAIFFLCYFGVLALLTGDPAYGQSLLGFALLTLITYLLIWRSGRYRLANHQVVALMAALCLYLFYSGGENGSGPLWFLVFPILALFLQGRPLGLYSITGLLLLATLVYVIEPGSFYREMYSIAFVQRLVAVYLAVTALAYLFAYFRDEAEQRLRQYNNQLETLSYWDKLSGLYSRRHCEEVLRQAVDKHQRYQMNFSLVLLQIDKLDHLRDTRGGQYTEFVIQEVSRLIERSLRKVDIPAHWGNGIFALVLTGSKLDGAAMLAERLRLDMASHPFVFDGSKAKITCSCGIAEFTGGRLDRFIDRIETHLATARDTGGNCVFFEAGGYAA